MWNKYSIQMQADRLTGGYPANPRLIEAWLSARKAPRDAEQEAALQVERRTEIDPEDQHTVAFWRDGNLVPHYESRCFKAALKEAANILGSSSKRKGILEDVNFRSKLAERVFVDPRIGGCPIKCGCGNLHNGLLHVEERPIQVMTAQGPRTSLKRVEYALNVPLKFELRVLEDGLVTERGLQMILEYLQDGGLGADRSQGSGTFQLVSFRKLG